LISAVISVCVSSHSPQAGSIALATPTISSNRRSQANDPPKRAVRKTWEGR
jgi:hypothetical protein